MKWFSSDARSEGQQPILSWIKKSSLGWIYGGSRADYRIKVVAHLEGSGQEAQPIIHPSLYQWGGMWDNGGTFPPLTRT